MCDHCRALYTALKQILGADSNVADVIQARTCELMHGPESVEYREEKRRIQRGYHPTQPVTA